MSNPESTPLRLDAPEPGFGLDTGVRARVRSHFDADALEKLLALVHPERRARMLVYFLLQEPGEPLEELVMLGNSELQELLEEVWFPLWKAHPELLDDAEQDAYRPGRLRAKARLAAEGGFEIPE